MALELKYNGEPFTVDNFCKIIMFQNIIDMEEIDNNSKNLLLYILRKTLCFNKFNDRLAMYHLQKQLKISENTLRKTIKYCEENNLISIERSVGGKTSRKERFNLFRLHNDLLSDLIRYVEEIRENNDFDI